MKIKDFFTDKSKWTKYKNFRDKDDNPIGFKDILEVKYGGTNNFNGKCCLNGAIMLCYYYTEDIIHERIVDYLREKSIISDFIRWNDDPNTTFEDIKQLVEDLDI